MHLRCHKSKEFEKLSKAQRRELVQRRHSNNGKEGPPSKRQRFSREDSRDKETRTLVSKLVAKELVEMKNAEKKKKLKGRTLKLKLWLSSRNLKQTPTRVLPCLLIKTLATPYSISS